jgi:hypothetical protein
MSSEKQCIEEIYDLFRKTFNSSNREEIDLAEKRLKELGIGFLIKQLISKNILTLFSSLFKTIQ